MSESIRSKKMMRAYNITYKRKALLAERDDLPTSEDVVAAKQRVRAICDFSSSRSPCYRVSPEKTLLRARFFLLGGATTRRRGLTHFYRARRGESFDFNGIPSIVGARRRSDATLRRLHTLAHVFYYYIK